MMNVLRFLGTGIGHEDDNNGCQDRLDYTKVGDEREIFVISDGCSSSKYAEEAAQCNVDIIKKLFTRLSICELTQESLIRLYPKLKEELLKLDPHDINACLDLIFRYEFLHLAKNLNVKKPSVSQFCATLLFVIVEKETTLVGNVGDGHALFFNKKGKLIYRSVADNGEDSSHTYFTLSEEFPTHLRLNSIPTDSYHSMIMFSDGPQTMFRLENGSVEQGACEIVLKPVVNKVIKTEKELAKQLQKSLGYAMHYGFDDWSIMVATKTNESNKIQPVSLNDLFYEVYNKNVQNEMDKNVQNEMDKNVQNEIDKNVQNEIDKNVQNEIDKNVQNEIDKNVQNEMDKNVPTKKGKKTIIITIIKTKIVKIVTDYYNRRKKK